MSLLRTAARASVATRVIGNTHRRQQQRWAAQDAASATTPPAPNPAGPVTASVLDQLTQLGQLRDAGVLNEAEFEAQKQRILST
ncbi:SHOCT domain-containing protein [Microbacterium sp. SSW1-49]|uniref:SHOCT domain-containing protein n=1 Tax=Microbacterium croceum TaxID=2851645 RepID=A0ABT0FJN1_9MICO|nr:SHOCT domain-containing protein [Microbacterium croceum]MCK2037904.1 SHOCT domain-containing protein [Microbacterium croceum]